MNNTNTVNAAEPFDFISEAEHTFKDASECRRDGKITSAELLFRAARLTKMISACAPLAIIKNEIDLLQETLRRETARV